MHWWGQLWTSSLIIQILEGGKGAIAGCLQMLLILILFSILWSIWAAVSFKHFYFELVSASSNCWVEGFKSKKYIFGINKKINRSNLPSFIVGNFWFLYQSYEGSSQHACQKWQTRIRSSQLIASQELPQHTLKEPKGDQKQYLPQDSQEPFTVLHDQHSQHQQKATWTSGLLQKS